MNVCPSCGLPVKNEDQHKAVMLDTKGNVTRVSFICPIDLKALN